MTVLERLDAPGGRAYVFRQDGFTFDAGPTIITAPFLLEELWALCGRRFADDIDLRPISPFYRIRFDDGETFNYTGDAAEMRAEVARFRPGDVAGYERFMLLSEELFRVGFEELGDKPFGSWKDMLRILPDLVRLRGYRSVYGLVARHLKDERLRTVLSFHPLLIGGNPFTASAIYALICFLERRWGVHFAMGGTGEVVRGLVGLIQGQGATLRCNAEVASITVRDGAATGVTLATGETIAADIVVSNADSAYTYRNLLPPSARRRWTDRKIDRSRYSMSLFVWYFGTDRRYDGRRAPHDPARAALSGIAARHLQPARAGRGFQPVSAPADRHRPVARAAGLRCVLRAVAGAASGQRHRLANGGRAVPEAHRTASCGDAAARSGAPHRDVADDDAAGFPGPAAFGPRRRVRAGAGADAKCLVSGRTTAARMCATCSSSAPAPIRARDCRAFCPRREFSTRWCPMHMFSPDIAVPTDPSPDQGYRADLAACRTLLRGGSRSFHAASLLLPRSVRDPATALYAFCRLADDAIDQDSGRLAALARLRERLARAYDGRPLPIPADRALAAVLARFAIPRELPEALLEGFAWDAAGRRYETLSDLTAYAVRVAGTVGAMMAMLMGVRAPQVVARACDLGVAMQFSNIARDVGEDAAAGRLYLPVQWLREAGIDPDAWLARPTFSPALGGVVQRLLAEAEALYARAGSGVRRLPLGCRPGIGAARLLYAEIGHEVLRRGGDSVGGRAVVLGAPQIEHCSAAALRKPRCPGRSRRTPRCRKPRI